MKKLSLSLFAVVLAATVAFGPATATAQQAAPATPHQVGLIDMAYIFQNYEKFTDQTDTLKKAAEQAQTKANAMVESLKQQQQVLQGLNPGSPDYAAQESKMIEAQTKLQTFQQVEQREITRKQAEVYKQIYLDVQKAVGEYANYYKYTLVLRFSREDVADSANPQQIIQGLNRQVVYHQEEHDITQSILDYLNQSYRRAKTAGK
ncbi:MAG: OmpH family outer membrane protein [Planctomycetaceae bacterium]|nr:OmpH family outer membrane protein [Planctomycetaceae bacterium]